MLWCFVETSLNVLCSVQVDPLIVPQWTTSYGGVKYAFTDDENACFFRHAQFGYVIEFLCSELNHSLLADFLMGSALIGLEAEPRAASSYAILFSSHCFDILVHIIFSSWEIAWLFKCNWDQYYLMPKPSWHGIMKYNI